MSLAFTIYRFDCKHKRMVSDLETYFASKCRSYICKCCESTFGLPIIGVLLGGMAYINSMWIGECSQLLNRYPLWCCLGCGWTIPACSCSAANGTARKIGLHIRKFRI